MHEHQSPARNMIFLNERTAIDFYCSRQGWTEDMVKEQILNVYNTADIGAFSQPDTASIMQYPVPAELSFTGEPIPYSECLRFSSFVTSGLILACPADSELSDMDKAYISIAYAFPSEHPPAAMWSLQKALDTAGVPADDQAKILSYAKDGKLNHVRATFLGNHIKAQRRLSVPRVRRAVRPSVISYGAASPRRVDRAFFNVMSYLMDYLPETAEAKAVAGPGMDVMATFDDPLSGPSAGDLLKDAVDALLIRAKQGVNKSQEFHDILTDPMYGPMLGNLLTRAVTAVKDSLGDDEKTPPNSAQHGMMDIIRHPVFQKVAKTLLDEAVGFVRDKVTEVASNPARAARPAPHGAAHGTDDVLKTPVPIISQFAQVALMFL
jgi:hypothetical protein